MMYGTKCADGPFTWKPETLGNLYRSVIDEYGEHALNKPVPGYSYRKMYKPITDMDMPSFRRLPEEIIITQPPRLFRSTGYKYKGRVYLGAKPIGSLNINTDQKMDGSTTGLRFASFHSPTSARTQ